MPSPASESSTLEALNHQGTHLVSDESSSLFNAAPENCQHTSVAATISDAGSVFAIDEIDCQLTLASDLPQMAFGDSSPHNSESKDSNEFDYASLEETSTMDSDRHSTATVDIALLQTDLEVEKEANTEDDDITEENLSEGSSTGSGGGSSSSSSGGSSVNEREPTTDIDEFSLSEDDRWGENRKRRSLMMRYALKNNLGMFAGHRIMNDHVEDSVKSNGCELDPYCEPDADIYAWATSCSNMNPTGPRYKLIKEGDVQVCYLDHTRTVISKILSFKCLRYFESHHLYLRDKDIYPRNKSARLTETSLDFSQISEVSVIQRWDQAQKYFLRIVVPYGSFLIQANNMYIRDQWYHSIMWKLQIYKYRNILRSSTKIDLLLKELKNFVEFVKTTPIQDCEVYNTPIEIISVLLRELFEKNVEMNWRQNVIVHISPLLEQYRPSLEMCQLFSDHCRMQPQSSAVQETFISSVNHILVHNVDFGKYPFMRKLLQDYIKALDYHSNSEEALKQFVARCHGSNYKCPHPRVMPNLVSSCLSAIGTAFEDVGVIEKLDKLDLGDGNLQEPKFEDPIHSYRCYLKILQYMSEYNDWLPGIASMLQPIPIHVRSLSSEYFVNNMGVILERITRDTRCNTHSQVLGSRVEKNGWFDIYCPANCICFDDGLLWSTMVDTLLNCCSRRKAFVMKLYEKQLESCLLQALRGNAACQSTLCLMLEWNLVKETDQQMLITTTLQSTESGVQQYEALCRRQQYLEKIQKKGGPTKLTLPYHSTDTDLSQLLSTGSFGNLECLTLAFTHITNDCAETLIKLPSLKYLNLWATQFSDEGLIVISEHLGNLQALNLCETPVTDKGIAALTSMTNLRWLNLNSTKLTAQMLEELRIKLPHLNELDVRYTEAW